MASGGHQSRKHSVIADVVEACIQEEKQGLMAPISRPYTRAALYTKKNEKTIRRIRKERLEQPTGTLKSPKKTRVKVGIDPLDKSVIRQTVEEFYTDRKIVPSLRKLLEAVREKIEFPWGRSKFHQVLKSMGFTWKKCNKQAFLTERHDIIDMRYRYLVQMRRLREGNRQFFFVDETWVDCNLTFRKCWRAKVITGYIIVHIGSSDGFLPGGKLVLKPGKKTGDYDGQMNHENFSKWIERQVLPNLPPHSVIVMDNATYRSAEANKAPCQSATKGEMISWLRSNGTAVNESLRKTVLYNLVVANKPPREIYRIDQLIESHGHTVVRLPPHNSDLNPMELAWVKLKNYVRSCNAEGDIIMPKLEELIENGINTITAEDWKGYCQQVEKLEARYWEKDAVIEDIMDSFVVNPMDDDEDEEDYIEDPSGISGSETEDESKE